MASTSTATLVDTLRQLRLLSLGQLAQLEPVAARAADPRALAKELLQRGWLTSFQVNQLLRDKGKELLLGPYVLIDRLGEGAMGEVYKARHRELDRIAALKIIRKERLSNPDAVRRFEREVRAASQLHHPNIVLALHADQVGDIHFLAMEFVEGTDLSRLVRKAGPLPLSAAVEYTRQAALGLAHAHEKGLVHRDIKPSNLMVCKNPGGTSPVLLKILDLGLARIEANADDDSLSQLTRDGVVVGTVDYMAPEQALNSHGVDHRADLYSLGCTFYFLLTGQVPFPGGSALDKLVRHRTDQANPVEKLRPDIPPEVATIVRRLLAKRPEDRYQTAAELASVLSVALHLPGVAASPSASQRIPAMRKGTKTEATRSTSLGSVQRIHLRFRRWVRIVVLLSVGLLVVGAGAATLLFRSNPASQTGTGLRPPIPGKNSGNSSGTTHPEEPRPSSVELFNGKDTTGWKTRSPNSKAQWFVAPVRMHPKDSVRIAVNPKAGENAEKHLTNANQRVDLYTEQPFGDGTLELEFMLPKSATSAIYLLGEYAIKLADSQGNEPVGPDDLGAVGSMPPRVNAARKAGDWQKLVVEYRAPRLTGTQKTASFRIVKLILNDQIVQENLDVPLPAQGGLTGKDVATGPLMIQGTTGPVAVRAVRFTPRPGSWVAIPPRSQLTAARSADSCWGFAG